MIRLLSASVAVANRSGKIIREVLRSGELGVVQKVSPIFIRAACSRARSVAATAPFERPSPTLDLDSDQSRPSFASDRVARGAHSLATLHMNTTTPSYSHIVLHDV